GDRGDTGVTSDDALHARADERRVGANQRYGLALHVGAHERAVGIVVLEEGHQTRGNRDQLLGRDVHERDVFGTSHESITGLTRRYAILGQATLLVGDGVGLSDDLPLFLKRRVELDVRGGVRVLDLDVRGLDEAVLVDAGKG